MGYTDQLKKYKQSVIDSEKKGSDLVIFNRDRDYVEILVGHYEVCTGKAETTVRTWLAGNPNAVRIPALISVLREPWKAEMKRMRAEHRGQT